MSDVPDTLEDNGQGFATTDFDIMGDGSQNVDEAAPEGAAQEEAYEEPPEDREDKETHSNPVQANNECDIPFDEALQNDFLNNLLQDGNGCTVLFDQGLIYDFLNSLLGDEHNFDIPDLETSEGLETTFDSSEEQPIQSIDIAFLQGPGKNCQYDNWENYQKSDFSDRARYLRAIRDLFTNRRTSRRMDSDIFKEYNLIPTARTSTGPITEPL
jgi:hypothetical protein